MNSLFNILLILIVPLCSIMKEQNKNDSTILSVTYDAYKSSKKSQRLRKTLCAWILESTHRNMLA